MNNLDLKQMIKKELKLSDSWDRNLNNMIIAAQLNYSDEQIHDALLEYTQEKSGKDRKVRNFFGDLKKYIDHTPTENNLPVNSYPSKSTEYIIESMLDTMEYLIQRDVKKNPEITTRKYRNKNIKLPFIAC